MSVTLSPLAGAGWQFFDANGVPLAGGLLYTYAAGTTTPAATYTSVSGAAANTNPIVLDAAGRVPEEVWLTAGQPYKFTLKTSAGVQIWSKDNVSGINDLNGVTFQYNAPNSVPRTLQSKLQDTVSVVDFGADPAGVADSTTAIQNAIDYVASLTYGGTVSSPPGATYKITGTLLFRPNVYIDFNESAVKQYTDNTFIFSAPTGSDIYRWGLSNAYLAFNTFQDGTSTVEVSGSTLVAGDIFQGQTTGATGQVVSVVGTTMTYLAGAGTLKTGGGEQLFVNSDLRASTTSTPVTVRCGSALRLADSAQAFDYTLEKLWVIDAYDGIVCPARSNVINTMTVAYTPGGVIAVGNTITGLASGATGAVTAVSGSTITFTQAVPTTLFNLGEAVQVGGVTQGTVSTRSSNTGTFAFVGRIQDYTASVARWAIYYDCSSAAGANTNVQLTNCWHLHSRAPAAPFASGFYFNACSQFQFQSLLADKICGPFVFAQSCSGWAGDWSMEAATINVVANNALQAVTLSDSNLGIQTLKFIGNTFNTYNNVRVASAASLAVGNVITGATSGCKGKITKIFGTLVTFTQYTQESFLAGENVQVGGVTKTTVTGGAMAMTVPYAGTIAVGNTITGAPSTASATVTAVGTAGGVTYVSYTITGTTPFQIGDTISVGGVSQGTASAILAGSNYGAVYLYRGSASSSTVSFTGTIDNYATSGNTYNGQGVYDVVPTTKNTSPAAGYFWVYNTQASIERYSIFINATGAIYGGDIITGVTSLATGRVTGIAGSGGSTRITYVPVSGVFTLGETINVSGVAKGTVTIVPFVSPELADFGTPKVIRLWNGDNRYYTVGMLAENYSADFATGSWNFTNPSNSSYAKDFVGTVLPYSASQKGGITMQSWNGSAAVWPTKIQLRTDGSSNPRLSIVGPDNAYGKIEVVTADGSAVETVRGTLADANGNFIWGTAALATTATNGFPWIPSCAGAPTGAPTSPYTNAAAMVVDTTNSRLYVRVGNTWKYAALV